LCVCVCHANAESGGDTQRNTTQVDASRERRTFYSQLLLIALCNGITQDATVSHRTGYSNKNVTELTRYR